MLSEAAPSPGMKERTSGLWGKVSQVNVWRLRSLTQQVIPFSSVPGEREKPERGKSCLLIFPSVKVLFCSRGFYLVALELGHILEPASLGPHGLMSLFQAGRKSPGSVHDASFG